MSEAQDQKKCRSLAAAYGWLSYKLAAPGHRGVPDVMFIKGGRIIFVEFKNFNGKGRLSALQTRTIERMQGAGADVMVIDSMKDFMEVFC